MGMWLWLQDQTPEIQNKYNEIDPSIYEIYKKFKIQKSYYIDGYWGWRNKICILEPKDDYNILH